MRRQRFWWTYLVGCIVCIIYGAWTLAYHFRKGNGLVDYGEDAFWPVFNKAGKK